MCLMSYAGDVSIKECWEVLGKEKNSQLVDVRTVAEWQFVGIPDLSGIGKRAHLIEWQHYPDMSVNAGFSQETDERLKLAGVNRGDSVFMLCRSGVRSMDAAKALTAEGYERVYNVMGGFEGDKDSHGHRGNVAGWKFEGCPWVQ